jgi:hypothetical protein
VKSALRVSFLLVMLALVSVADPPNIDGHWTVRYVGGVAWKTIADAEFEFKADGDSLTGMAIVGQGYPGEAPISNGRIEGDHISFRVYGKQPSSSGFPKMDFVGSIHGDVIELTMTLFYDEQEHGIGSTELEGKRDSTK